MTTDQGPRLVPRRYRHRRPPPTAREYERGNTAHGGQPETARLPSIWVRLSIAAALLAIAGSVTGLLAVDSIYGRETYNLTDAVIAQDVVTLFVVAPLLRLLSTRAGRGYQRSWWCWLGCLSFTVYNYAIYTVSIHFGPLSLAWIAVLGLSLFALIGGLTALNMSAAKARLADASVRLCGWFLIAVAVLFSLLWVSEIVPDLIAGRSSSSAEMWRVPTNPVHVLDLAFFHPSVCMTGVLLLRRRQLGYATAAGQLTFLGLICLPILVTPFAAAIRDHPPGWPVVVPIGILALAISGVLRRLLRTPRLSSA